MLATAHATDKKTVTLDFRGEGQRKVRVGYIQETPVWKTSYRLVLERREAALAAGLGDRREPHRGGLERRAADAGQRPADLLHHGPVPADSTSRGRWRRWNCIARCGPQAYEQDLARREVEFRRAAAARPAEAGQARMARRRWPLAAATAAPGMRRPRGRAASAASDERRWNLRQGVQSLATAGNVGELFQYAIATPVTLSRHESAMLPIVKSDVKAEKVSIYNPAVQPKHPLNGLRLTNSTELHLMQGPITVFDGGVYAGDAKIDDIAPGSERLVSYALDLDTEVAPESKGQPGADRSACGIVKGTLIVEPQVTRSAGVHDQELRPQGEEGARSSTRYDPDWTLVAPKEPAEKTRDQYRFAVEAKPGVPAKLVVEEQRIEPQQLALTQPRRQHDHVLHRRQGGQRQGQGGPGRGDQAEAGDPGGGQQAGPARAADPHDRRGAGPHPREHGPAGSRHRPLQAVREEVLRPGGRDREAPRRRSRSCRTARRNSAERLTTISAGWIRVERAGQISWGETT